MRLLIDDCVFGYAARDRVVDGVSLACAAGELVAVVGPNGSGKTTLLRIAAGQLRPRSGRVVVDGVPLAGLGPSARARRVAFMPQIERHETGLTVHDVVRLGRTPHRGWWLPFTTGDDTLVAAALAATGLTSLADRPVCRLSGGEWRRTILARALAQQADVLLLDEPLAGLDVRHRQECLAAVRGIVSDHGRAAVVTMHDLNLAQLFADRVVVLGHGRCLASGPPREVLTADVVGRAFGIEVSMVRHPLDGTPLVVPNAVGRRS